MGLSGSILKVPTKQSKICGDDFAVWTLETNLCSKAIKVVYPANAFHECVSCGFWCGLLSPNLYVLSISFFFQCLCCVLQ